MQLNTNKIRPLLWCLLELTVNTRAYEEVAMASRPIEAT